MWIKNIFTKTLARYGAVMQARPLATKFCSGGVIFALGDVIAQHSRFGEGKAWNDVDLARTCRTAAVGAFFSGWLHFWWGGLERAGAYCLPNGKLANTAFKVFFDQALSAPMFNVSYVYIISQLEGMGHDASLNRTINTVPEQMVLHYKVWPAFHMFNFYFVPLHYRVIAMNFIKVGWSGLMSYRLQGKYQSAPKKARPSLPMPMVLRKPLHLIPGPRVVVHSLIANEMCCA